jgi:hypothetical protein
MSDVSELLNAVFKESRTVGPEINSVSIGTGVTVGEEKQAKTC